MDSGPNFQKVIDKEEKHLGIKLGNKERLLVENLLRDFMTVFTGEIISIKEGHLKEKLLLERGIREWQSIHKQCSEKLKTTGEYLKRISDGDTRCFHEDLADEALSILEGDEPKNKEETQK